MSYQYLIVPLFTLITTQFIKFIMESIKDHHLKWGRLFNGSGGMPSSHSAFASSVTVLLGLKLGFDSPMFALALVFSLIVCYDAMGLRKESGKQAMMLNQVMDEVFSLKKQGWNRLKEELGHNPVEVLCGILYGSLIAFLSTVL